MLAVKILIINVLASKTRVDDDKTPLKYTFTIYAVAFVTFVQLAVKPTAVGFVALPMVGAVNGARETPKVFPAT